MTHDAVHVAELIDQLRTVPLEELQEAGKLLLSIRYLNFLLAMYWELPRPAIADCTYLEIVRAPRDNRIRVAQYVEALIAAAHAPSDDMMEEAFEEVLAVWATTGWCC